MAATVRAHKGLITKRRQMILDWLQATATLLEPLGDSTGLDTTKNLRLALRTCNEHIDLLTASIEKLTQAFDALPDCTSEEEELLDKQVASAEEVIMSLHTRKSELQCVLSGLQEDREATGLAPNRTEATLPGPLSVSKLPVIPIPTFTGKRWDWDNYWALFRASIHDQDLTELQKFNYLISSLSGEAKSSISRFQITPANYMRAVAHLEERYGNKDGIVLELNRSLHLSSAKSPNTTDQRRLFDRLSSIAAQLRGHGEHLDNQLTIQTFVQKFHPRLQKAVINKRLKKNDTEWTLEDWLNSIERFITQEEHLKNMLPKEEQEKDQNTIASKGKKTYGTVCENCQQKGHRWTYCTRLPDPSSKRTFLLESKRCLNCGSPAHRLSECSSGNCRTCQGRHHTMICTKRLQGDVEQDAHKRRTPPGLHTPRPAISTPGRQLPKQQGKARVEAKQHVVVSDTVPSVVKPEEETVILHMNERHHEITARDSNKVILLAGSARLLDRDNHMKEVTVLLDTGSELSFIDEHFAQDLGLPVVGRTTLRISTFGSPTPKEKSCGITTLQLCDTNGTPHEVHLHRHDFITNIIEQADLDQEDLKFISEREIHLSLPVRQDVLQPKILLGCDYLWTFMESTGHLYLPSGLLLIPTSFGYIISGRKSHGGQPEPTTVINAIQAEESEKELWDRYWTLETTGTEEFSGPEKTELQQTNQRIMEDFRSTIEHRPDGYYVRLPWKRDSANLPDNKTIALQRLRKLLEMHDDNTLRQYDEIFHEQLDKGVIEEVPWEKDPEAIVHYLPHQAVITPHKETTKMRIVFDASAHYKDRPSLNDVLHQGPLILPDLVGMLMRFRLHNIVIISDVEKAFLQVRIHELDRDATRCLWIRDISQPLTMDNIVEYRFTRVTFGLNCSPFLLGATIRHHLENSMSHSDIADEINYNLYVDNLILGAQCVDEALDKYAVAKNVFNGLQMNLREFLSNDEHFNATIVENDGTKTRCTKVLGVPWNSQNDTIILKGNMAPAKTFTKRTVSQQLASVYDPLGFLVPVLLPAKVFLQSLWKDDFSWDTPLPTHLCVQWRAISGQISTFYKELPRQNADTSKECTIFAFADASQFAMAACIYIGCGADTNLALAKSKLPSMKTATTIPKMEMNAITLCVRATTFTVKALAPVTTVARIHFFSDSEVVLGWLRTPPERQTVGVLVSNRLKEIRRTVDALQTQGIACRFGYVPTNTNPADCGTRGIATSLLQNHFWWRGPDFIRTDVSQWPPIMQPFPLTSLEDDDEMEDIPTCIVATTQGAKNRITEAKMTFDLSRMSSMNKALRVVAYCLRFIRRLLCNLTTTRKEEILRHISVLQTVSATHEFTGQEMRGARKCIIQDHQRAAVTDHQIISQKNLNIQKDSDGLLRCFGRLSQADIPQEAVLPIYIAPNTSLASLLIWEAHNQYHKGVAHTIAATRQNYWIPRIRQQVRTLINQCVPCQRFTNLPFKYPQMAALPRTRVQKSRPFQHIGLDYFGPLQINSAGAVRKVWGCIFTCQTTRLTHLEIVEDNTTEKFLNALRRFFARRGIPSSITSDNAPTFLLGEQILNGAVHRMIEEGEVDRALAQREIDWHHITPYAPWQGGFYERLIRSIKHSLHKTLGQRTVSFDVLCTMMTEIEAVVNSRPLTYQEEQWELQPLLRPIDFLQKDILLTFPLDYVDNEKAATTYYTAEEAQQLRTRRAAEEALSSSYNLTERFWKIWKTQYLTSLREHHKLQMDSKRGSAATPEIGKVVLLCDSTLPRNAWQIGRISSVKTSANGSIREAEVVLPNKRKVRRPINLLVPLELSEDSSRDTAPSSPSSSTSSPRVTPDDSPIIPGDDPSHHSSTTRYNLRKRKSINYNENSEDCSENSRTPTPRSEQTNVLRAWPLFLALLSLMIKTAATNNTHQLQCIEGGAIITQHPVQPYELCAEDYCVTYTTPRQREVIHLPPRITLHDHVIKWKTLEDTEIRVMEATCKSAPFCAQIDCTFCTETLTNPECWPRTAIFVAGLAIYLLTTLCYFLFYVPVIIGTPVMYLLRTIGFFTFATARATVQLLVGTMAYLSRKIRRRRGRRLWSDAIILLAVTGQATPCQDVDVYAFLTHSCHQSDTGELCTIDTAQIVKINPFKQEACLRLTRNETTLLEVQLLWKYLNLVCDKETISFTRSTRYELLDSKRCPHAGSCSGEKCGAINRTSQIPELVKANNYPGVTGCVESCGGLGCDCFYPSSGCLFYRIYLVPNDEAVYELYRCTIWKEWVDVQLTITRPNALVETHHISVVPNQPKVLPALTITLSALGIPPAPILNSRFLTDGTHTALAPTDYDPPLQCESWEHAQNMTCEVNEDCKCAPAEDKMLCDCKDFNLTSHILSMQHRLPILRPTVELHTISGHIVGRIPHLPTAEFILRIKDRFNTTSIVSDAICRINSTHITGCYNCAKGARTTVVCQSSTTKEMAEILCGTDAFTVPCAAQGRQTELRFTAEQARFHVNCTVRCGRQRHSFTIVGILRYTGSMNSAVRRLLNGESEVFAEINLPDFGHLIDIFLQWCGTLLITALVVAVALLLTYLYATSTSVVTFVTWFIRSIVNACCMTCRIIRTLACMPLLWFFRPGQEYRTKPQEKLL